MTKLGLFVALEAKTGQEEHLAAFLRNALPLVEAEPKTASWFAIQLAPSKFGIFDTFLDEEGREAHLSGEVQHLSFPAIIVRPQAGWLWKS